VHVNCDIPYLAFLAIFFLGIFQALFAENGHFAKRQQEVPILC